MSSGLKRRLFIAACTLLLLLAQHTALAHAVWHALQGPPAQHEHAGGTEKSTGSALCAFDAAIGEILGSGAPLAACLFHVQRADVAHIDSSLLAVPAQRFLAPLSRGPPALS